MFTKVLVLNIRRSCAVGRLHRSLLHMFNVV